MRALEYEKQFIVSCDLGFAQDWTAIAVHERVDAKTGREKREWEYDHYEVFEEWKGQYELRHLERPKQRTPYPEICARLRDIMMHPSLLGNGVLIVDATGVGRPVVQMMEEVGLEPIPVLITGGQRESVDDDGTFHVPKRVLVSSLQVVFQEKRIRVAQDIPLVPDFLKELDAFKMKQNTKTLNVAYEAWRESDHDDLVLAAGLGIWYGETQLNREWVRKTLSPQDPIALDLDRESRERHCEEESDRREENQRTGKGLPVRSRL